MCRTPSYFINKPLSLENSKISVCVSVLGSAFIHFYQFIGLILSLDYVSIGQLPKWTMPMILLRYFADKVSKIIWWKKHNWLLSQTWSGNLVLGTEPRIRAITSWRAYVLDAAGSCISARNSSEPSGAATDSISRILIRRNIITKL